MTDVQEKLRLIDEEILSLQQYCQVNNFSSADVQAGAEPLLKEIKKYYRKRLACILLSFLGLCSLGATLFYCDTTYQFIRVHARLASIKVLPLFDWTRLYDSPCLLYNPYFMGTELVEEDCQVCAPLGPRVPELEGVTASVVWEEYITHDLPFIVSDATHDWPASQEFNLAFLRELYESEQPLRSFAPCMFASSLQHTMGSPRVVLQRALGEQEGPGFYAHWENCDKSSAKVFRQYYQRPHFLPPNVELCESNWLLLARGHTTQQYKSLDVNHPLVWLAVLRGELRVALTPRTPCTKICPQLVVLLKPGQILVLTDALWMLDYVPSSDHEVVAIAGGGYFD